MELVTPGLGLIIWMTLAFLLLLFILTKFAWKPVMKSLKDRSDSIEGALQLAEKTREEMAKLQASNEQLLREAREERDNILKDARKVRDSIVEDAKASAVEEVNRLKEIARQDIQNEKMAAITELKNQIAQLSVEIAGRMLKEDLSNDVKHREYAEKLLKEMKLN